MFSWCFAAVCLVSCVSVYVHRRYQRSFHGVNLTSLHDVALQEYFHQPVVVSTPFSVVVIIVIELLWGHPS